MRHVQSRWILAVAALWATLGAWMVIGQNATIVPPFFSTPALNAIFFSNFIKGATILARKLDGSYVQIQYLRTPPYLFGDPTTVVDYLNDGVAALLAAPAGPPGVALAGGLVTAGKFTTSGDPGAASISLIRNRNSVSVHRATLARAYNGATLYAVGPEAAAVVSGDLTGDGVADLAVAYSGNFNGTPGGVGILVNKGDGSFNAAVPLSVGTQPVGITIFDLNRDGKLDLMVPDSSGSNVYVLLGNGNGTFASPAAYVVGANPQCIIAADFNGDGQPDLAVSAADGTISVLLGNGNGTFQARTSFPAGSGLSYLAGGDFNKDGKIDLAEVARSQTVAVYLGNGSGGFSKASEYTVSYSVQSMVITDLNRDGNPDILIGQGDARIIGPDYDSQKIDILLGRGDGTFGGASSTATGAVGFGGGRFVTTSDWNGDGLQDAITGDYYKNVIYVLNGRPNGAFAPPVTITLPGSGQLLVGDGAAGDFNGDGRADLAITEGNPGMVAILLNSGGSLQQPSTFSSGGSKPTSITAADFDGDGKLDLAVANSSGQAAVFRGGGNGAFQLLTTYPTGLAPAHITAADVNGDSKPDLIVVDPGNQFTSTPVKGAVYLLLNSGGGAFQNPVSIPGPDYPVSATTGDANGDGKQDLAITGDRTGSGDVVALAFGNGNGTFQAATFLRTDFGPRAASLRDFNGDGKADIVVTHCCGDTDMTYFQGTGNGAFSAEVHFNGGASPIDLETPDLDGNGTPDLVIAGNDGAVTGLLNTSLPTNGPRLDVLSGASYAVDGPLAPLAIAVGFGSGLSVDNAVGTSPWPATLVGTSVAVKDSLGIERPAPLVYVFPAQISFLIPAGSATGAATVNVLRNGTTVARGAVTIAPVSPGLITANSNGQGVASAVAIHATSGGAQTSELIFSCAAAGNCSPIPIDLGPTSDVVVLTLYGTGIRGRSSLTGVTAVAGGANLEVLYAGAQGQYDGLDQVNVKLPSSLTGRGLLTLTLTVDGKAANSVQFRVK